MYSQEEHEFIDEVPLSTEELFRATFDAAAIGLAHVGLDGRWLRVNAKLCSIVGYSADELLCKTFQDITHPDDLNEDIGYMNQLLHGEKHSFVMRKRYLKKNDEIVWVKLTVSMLRCELKEPLCFISAVEDISRLVEMETALQQSEERYRHIVEDQTDLICQYTPELRLTFVNQSYAAMKGKTPDELIGQNMFYCVPPNYHDGIRDSLALISSTNPMTAHENPLQLPDGSLRWFNWTNQAILDDNGNICDYQAIGRDITDRKLAEIAEHEQRLLVEAILNDSPNAMILLSSELSIERINHAVGTMFGDNAKTYLQQSIFNFIAQEDVLKVQSTIDRLLATGTTQQIEVNVLRKNATRFIAQLSIGQIEQGRFVCRFTDITERKAYERMLLYQASLLSHVSDAIVSVNVAGEIQSWNRAAEAMLGWRAEEVLGRQVKDVMQKELSAEEDQQVIQGLEQQGQWKGEVFQRCKDGTRLRVLRSVAALINDKGELYGHVSVNHDITALYETREKENELAALKAQLSAVEKEKELNELKARFVSMASHEFRTPIASILALTETLSAYRHRMDDEQIDQRLTKIKLQLAYLKTIMEDVLLLARLQERKAEFNPKPIDLDAFCRSIIEEFQDRPEITHALEYSCHTVLPHVWLDAKLMRQIINNLISNAIKYSPACKPVQLVLDYQAEAVLLSVRDQGIGIPETDIPYLFEPFHRAENVGTINGTGLGLTIVKEAVELHGGAVTVQSKERIGTTFCVRIPVSLNNEEVYANNFGG